MSMRRKTEDAMKVLIQNPLTLSYLQNVGTWTSDPDKACSFGDSRSAIQFCLNNDMDDMQVVLKGPDPRFDVQVPVGLQPSLGVAAQAW
jgi:hypothetical protein